MTLDPKEYSHLIPETKALVNKVVKKNMADGILFSAGTDTTIIAYEAVKYKPDIPALTIAFKEGAPKDTQYVKKMVEFLKLKDHQTHVFDKAEAIANVPKVVKALKTFDPMDVRNSMPVYIGLTILKKKGLKTVFTGDGLDELFGYPWQFHLNEEEMLKKQKDMWAEMGFSSIPMAKSLGMEVKQPYLDPLFMEWAKKLPIKVKINMHDGEKYSKWLMRKSYEDVVPKDVIWRPKAPLEAGTGAAALHTVLEGEFTDKEFAEKKKKILDADNVIIRDKEQLLYYEAFRKIFGKPSEVFPKSPAQNSAPNAKATLKQRFSSAKYAELIQSNFFFFF